jgi:hypothetical protein
MSEIIKSATAWMIQLANNPKAGYDQASRWRPDFDCSSAVITAYQQAGVAVKSAGATYTGNMRPAFLKCGFKDVTGRVNLATGAGLEAGDVLLNYIHHTAMYIGSGKEAEASINERGRATGGKTGDQTGKEILIRGYRNFPWDCVLRYAGNGSRIPQKASRIALTAPLIEMSAGITGEAVKALQALLVGYGYGPLCIDGEFGECTDRAVRRYQEDKRLEIDGEVGAETWKSLLGM